MQSFKIFYNQSKFIVESLEYYKQSLYNLGKILNEYDINYCIVGSIVMTQYNYVRMTEDIDILVNSKDKQKLLSIPPGLIRTYDNTERRIKLISPSTNIDVLYSGDKGDDKEPFIFPTPETVSNMITINDIEIPFLSLKQLILFKLRSGTYAKGRLNDLADVQKLIQLNNLPENYCDDCRIDIKKQYRKLYYT